MSTAAIMVSDPPSSMLRALLVHSAGDDRVVKPHELAKHDLAPRRLLALRALLAELRVSQPFSFYTATTFEDITDYSDAIIDWYRRDNWQDQPNHVQVWCEKDAVTGSIERITDKWAVPLRALRLIPPQTFTRSPNLSATRGERETRRCVLSRRLGSECPSMPRPRIYFETRDRNGGEKCMKGGARRRSSLFPNYR